MNRINVEKYNDSTNHEVSASLNAISVINGLFAFFIGSGQCCADLILLRWLITVVGICIIIGMNIALLRDAINHILRHDCKVYKSVMIILEAIVYGLQLIMSTVLIMDAILTCDTSATAYCNFLIVDCVLIIVGMLLSKLVSVIASHAFSIVTINLEGLDIDDSTLSNGGYKAAFEIFEGNNISQHKVFNLYACYPVITESGIEVRNRQGECIATYNWGHIQVVVINLNHDNETPEFITLCESVNNCFEIGRAHV